MSTRSLALLLSMAAVLIVARCDRAHADEIASRTRYQIRGALNLDAPQIDAVAHIAVENTASRPIDDVVLVRFAERFALPDDTVDDFNRPFIHPHLDFDPGRMEIIDIRDDGRAAPWEVLHVPQLPDGVFVRVPIAPLAPGERRTLTVRFHTVVPERFGSFGYFRNQLTLVGGWYPYVPRLAEDGTWRIDEPPPHADFDINLRVPRGLAAFVNGEAFPAGNTVVATTVSNVPYASIVAAPDWQRRELVVGATRIVLWQRLPHWTHRISIQPLPEESILATVRDVLQHSTVPRQRPATLTIVEAPLRLQLSAPGEGMVLLSDRALKVNTLLQSFHEVQLAQAVYAELLRDHTAQEANSDWVWVRDGMSRALARRWLHGVLPAAWSVYDWIDLFNVFALVDRFESEPRIPFVSSFFERARVADPLRGEVTTFHDAKPPGRQIFAKLDAYLGDAELDRVVDACADDERPFRLCAAATTGRDLDGFFAQWLQPYPMLNYSLSPSTRFNEPSSGGYQQTIAVHREASRPIVEPIPIRLRGFTGEPIDVQWRGDGNDGEVTVETPNQVWQATIDPDRKLIEDRRDDNTRPFAPQVVLDTAEVEVSSTEFGISGLFVGRNRYDYRKDLAAVAFYTNRSVGFTFGARWHGGTPIDTTRYRHNAYLFYAFQSLNRGFHEDGVAKTPGNLGSLGVRYEYTNVFSFDNPTHERTLRLYTDWFDRGLGGDYDYVDWGALVTATQPLGSYRTIGACQLLNGFSAPINNSTVPNQGQYSLGGSRSIRGIGAEDELGRNILMVRAEVRQEIFPEVDWNLLDLLVVRRHQLRLFVDSGRVSDAAGRIYDVSKFAVGVGVGGAVVYDFMGFFPSMAYIEVATRVDRSDKIDDVQFLFGTRQAF